MTQKDRIAYKKLQRGLAKITAEALQSELCNDIYYKNMLRMLDTIGYMAEQYTDKMDKNLAEWNSENLNHAK
jgi:hypothetical protein